MSNNDIIDIEEDIPNEFLCPITLEIMDEPMVMPDGQTYEKEAIKRALEVTHVSPLTKMPMNFSDGVINYTLKSLIEKYKEEHKIKESNKDKDFNINISKEEPIKVEFEELNARFISSDKSADLCKDSVFVSVKPKKVKAAPPVFLICVVDISGSMNSNCCQNIENVESMYLTRLDLVKHSLKTIISTLRKQDMICIIQFNQKAKTVIQPTVLINKDVKDKVIKDLEKMESMGSTNIWDGMKIAIETSKNIELENYQKSIMVFTDGDSNINPPKGVYPTLKETLKTTKDNFTISTFSFGNDAGPQLLIDIAKLGNGVYGYCPDGSMVGTIFINYMANLLSTITPVAKIVLTQGNNVHKAITVGPLYRGTRRNTIFLVNKDLLDQTKVKIELPYLNQEFEVPLTTESFDLQNYINQMIEVKSSNNDNSDGDNNQDEDEEEILDEEDDETDEDTIVVDIDDIDTNIIIEEKDDEKMDYGELLYNQILRNKFLLILNKLLKADNVQDGKAKNILNDYFELLKQLKYKTKFAKSLIIDIKDPDPNHGQVDKAIDLEYFYKWGQCYLNSLYRFHQFEQCGNFKDQSLQYYSSEVFANYRSMANKIFVNLPPPEAHQPRPLFGGNITVYGVNNNNVTINRSNNAPIPMRSFLNRHGGCFNGEAIVLLANGMTKCVKDLKKGDCLNNGAIVKCLIEQISGDNDLSKPYMCDINGVLLTPYHPVSINNQWNFPADLVQAKPVSIKSWFNLVLEDPINQKYEVEFDNGVKAITLGHYRTENSVLKHPYFGTDLVLKDLEERDPQGYSNGYIYIDDFDPRQLQYDENQCCINYYKIQSNTTTINNNQLEMINENNAINLAC